MSGGLFRLARQLYTSRRVNHPKQFSTARVENTAKNRKVAACIPMDCQYSSGVSDLDTSTEKPTPVKVRPVTNATSSAIPRNAVTHRSPAKPLSICSPHARVRRLSHKVTRWPFAAKSADRRIDAGHAAGPMFGRKRLSDPFRTPGPLRGALGRETSVAALGRERRRHTLHPTPLTTRTLEPHQPDRNPHIRRNVSHCRGNE